MKILALDLGSTTGFAHNTIMGGSYGVPEIYSRTWATDKELRDAKARRLDRRGDIRVIRFYDYLTDKHAQCKFDVVVFEDVKFVKSRCQAQLWSSFRAVVWLAFPNTHIECVDTTGLKIFATGKGGADKMFMSAQLHRDYPNLWNARLDDNAVDAAWLWLWAKTNLGRMKV